MCSVCNLPLGTFCPTCPLSSTLFLSLTDTPSGTVLSTVCPHLLVACPVAAKEWPPPRHLACAVLTKFPFVPLIIGPLCCPPSFSRVLGWLLSLSALLLHRVCVFHLLNRFPRIHVWPLFSHVMCSLSELIPSPDVLSTVIYRESPSLTSGWMFLAGHPSTPTVHVYCARVSCDHGLEVNLSLEQQANIVLYVSTLLTFAVTI